MATSCEDISARMMELLYGELPDGERAAFEAHIAGCARCRAERAGFENTRAMARGALDEPVPARAHAAILRAAAEHLETTRAAAQAAAKAAPARASFWDWLRTKWTWPTLATVGAVAVVLIASKVFLDPKKVHERGEQVLAPAPATPTPTPTPAPAVPVEAKLPSQPLEPAATAPDFERTAEAGKSHHVKAKAKSAPRPAKAGAAKGLDDGDLLGGSGSGVSGLLRGNAKPAAGGKGELGGSRLAGGGSVASSSRQFAPPPPPKPAAAPSAKARRDMADAPALAEGQAGKADKAGSVDELLSSVKEERARKPAAEAPGGAAIRSAAPPATASAPAPAAAEPMELEKRVSRKKAAPEKDSPAAETSAGPPADNKPGAGYGRSTASSAPEALIQRAERFYTEGRWVEAAAAYRELLRLDPGNASAGRWRQRLSLAQAQAEGDAIAARKAAVEREAAAARESAAPARESAPAKASRATDSK